MIVIGLPLWGQSYVERWADYSAQTLLAERNLPSLSQHHQVELQIVTTPDSVMYLENLQILQVMREICRVTITAMSATTSAYAGMTRANVITLNYASEAQAKHILTLGDQIWANGSFSAISQRLEKSAAVLSWGGMLDRAHVAPVLDQYRLNQVIDISSTQLADLTMRFPHTVQRNWIVEPGYVPRTPSSMIWTDPLGTSAVVRSHILILHGIDFAKIDKVRARRYLRKLSRGRVNDDVAIYGHLLDVEDAAIIETSDEVITVSLDDDSRSSLNSSRMEVDIANTEDSVLDSLRHHQPWEPQLGRYFFSVPYIVNRNGDEKWLRQTVDETFDLAMRASTLGRGPAFLGSIWVRLSQTHKTLIIRVFNIIGLLRPITRKLIGYELRRNRNQHQ